MFREAEGSRVPKLQSRNHMHNTFYQKANAKQLWTQSYNPSNVINSTQFGSVSFGTTPFPKNIVLNRFLHFSIASQVHEHAVSGSRQGVLDRLGSAISFPFALSRDTRHL